MPRGDSTNLTHQQIKQVHRDNLAFPKELAEIPRARWPQTVLKLTGDSPMRVWRSRQFMAILWLQIRGNVNRFSVNRLDFDLRTRQPRDDISWDELQRLKREAGLGDRIAIEIYPPDDRIVNVANMRHLFLIDEAPPFMW